MGKVKNLITLGLTGMYILAGSHAAVKAEGNCNGNGYTPTEIDYRIKLNSNFEYFKKMLNIGQGCLSNQDFAMAFMEMNDIKTAEEFNAALNIQIYNQPVTADMFTDIGAMSDNPVDTVILEEIRQRQAKFYEDIRNGDFNILEDENFIQLTQSLTWKLGSLSTGGAWAAQNIGVGHMTESLRVYIDLYAPKDKKGYYFNIVDGRFEDRGKRPADDCQEYWDAVIGRYFFFEDQLAAANRTNDSYLEHGCDHQDGATFHH